MRVKVFIEKVEGESSGYYVAHPVYSNGLQIPKALTGGGTGQTERAALADLQEAFTRYFSHAGGGVDLFEYQAFKAVPIG